MRPYLEKNLHKTSWWNGSRWRPSVQTQYHKKKKKKERKKERKCRKSGVIAYTCNSSTQEAEAG
jgi:hypothetical protein